MKQVLTAVLVCLSVVTPGWAQPGRLEQIRTETSGASPEPTPEKEPKRKKSSNNNDDSDSGWSNALGEIFSDSESSDLWGEIYAGIFTYTILAPFRIPNYLIEGKETKDGSTIVLDNWFQRYPYDQKPGWMYFERIRRREIEDPEVVPPPYLHRNSLRLSFEAGSDFRDLDRLRGELFLETSEYRVGIHATADYFRERRGCGCYDDTVLGTVNFTLRFAQNERIQMHTGIGLIALVDDRVAQAGFNWQYGITIFPVQPVSGFMQVELGNLGKAFQLHLRAGVGVHWRWIEGMAGYDYRQIGSVDLSGPFAGLRLWF